MKEIINVALCEGRHQIPEAVDGSIFPQVIENPTDIYALEEEAFIFFDSVLYPAIKRPRVANIYVTGMTVALIATLNVARRENILVTLFHYDRETGEYFPQQVV